MSDPSLFVLCGLSRLTVRVAHALHAQGGDVVVLRRAEGAELLPALGGSARVAEVGSDDYADALRAVNAGGAACLLALAEDDGDNLRALAAARAACPDVPLVLRCFDPALADVAEAQMGVRRAFSVSALAAPGFVAAAAGADVPISLRLGDADVPLCRLTVTQSSPLLGLSAAQTKTRTGCALLASARLGHWEPVTDSATPLQAGDEVLLGGLQSDVLRLCVDNAGWRDKQQRPARHKSPRARTPRVQSTSRLPLVAALLVAVLALSVGVFARALHLPFVDALYFVVTTATTTGYGDISLKDAPAWVKLFGCAVMLTGGALLGIVFSHLAARATAERLDEDMGRRAAQMSGHVVLAGLGTIGFRMARQLSELGLPFVVIEQQGTRFTADIRAPVLSGDVRLPETLARAGIDTARVLVACTDNDVANIGACLHARRQNPSVVTVARIFDDALAAGGAFGITRTVSASGFAASAFVSAALDENAVRVLRVGDLELKAVRLALSAPLLRETVDGWRGRGVRVLAFRAGGTACRPSELMGPLSAGDEVIVCGPAHEITPLLDGNFSAPAVS